MDVIDVDGWIKIHEDGTPLRKLHRGYWGYIGLKIIDVKIDENGKTVWIKVGKDGAVVDVTKLHSSSSK